MKDLYKLIMGIKGKTLMVVFPHPDDESMMTGGLLCLAHKCGVRSVILTLTRGGSGKMFIHPRGRSTRDIRGLELECAAGYLQADKLILGDYSDGNLLKERETWSNWVGTVIAEEKPSIIFTYDHSGLTGHPDHITLSQEIFKIIKKYNTKNKDKNIQLFWISLGDKLKKWFVPEEVKDNFQKPTHYLDIKSVWFRKWLAIKSHRSQRYAQIKITFPLWIFLSKYHYEWYHKVDLKKKYHVRFMNFKI